MNSSSMCSVLERLASSGHFNDFPCSNHDNSKEGDGERDCENRENVPSNFSFVDAIILDLGVSSMQLDTATRGFRYGNGFHVRYQSCM